MPGASNSIAGRTGCEIYCSSKQLLLMPFLNCRVCVSAHMKSRDTNDVGKLSTALSSKEVPQQESRKTPNLSALSL